MDQLNWYFKQRVAATEMGEAFQKAEAADHALLVDLFTGGFLLANVAVVEDSPQSQSISVGAIAGYDTLGQRVTEPAQLFSFAGDDDAVLATQARLYVKFKRDESVPRVDGLNNVINFKLDEGAELQRDLGTPGGGLPALRVDESILLANVNIPAAGGVITNADIDTSGQNLKTGLGTSALADFNPADFTMDGYIGEIKILTDRGAGPVYDDLEVEFCRVLDQSGQKVLALSVSDGANRIMDPTIVGAGGIDVGILNPDTWYYLHIIGDTNGVNPTTTLLSLQPGAPFGGDPALPAGYDVFRRIGVFRTDSTPSPNTNWIPARKIDRVTLYESWQVVLSTAAGFGRPGPGAVPVPAGARIPGPVAERAIIHLRAACTGANFGLTLSVFSGASNPTSTAPQHAVVSGGGGAGASPNDAAGQGLVDVDASGDLDASLSNPGPSAINFAEIAVVGYIDDMKHAS